MNFTYKCISCKRDFNEEPAMKNGAGSFCRECEDRRLVRVRAGMYERSRRLGDDCLWCGDVIVEKTTDDDHVCGLCKTMRSRVLKCIRNSDRVGKYVAAREEREKESREERARRPRVTELEEAAKTKSDSDGRLSKMEKQMRKLCEALGVPTE